VGATNKAKAETSRGSEAEACDSWWLDSGHLPIISVRIVQRDTGEMGPRGWEELEIVESIGKGGLLWLGEGSRF